MSQKIGVFFIDKSYSIYHVISVLIELVQQPNVDVYVFSSPRNYPLISSILEKQGNKNIHLKIVRPYWYFTLPLYLEIKLQLRAVIFYKYRKQLSSFDLIFCTLYNDLTLKKTIPDASKIKFAFASHGIVNRSYSFDDSIKAFDLIFLSGIKEYNIRKELNQLTPTNHALTGYVKHDMTQKLPAKSFFNNNNPTVLYNPHWELHLTSFFKYGFDILDFFASNTDYNLIFAPHSLLLERNKLIWFKFLKYKKHSNILIDLGSEASNDMSYTKVADLYLGDISSQALEFLLVKRRPCLFIDAHDLAQDTDDSYISWQAGDVISNTNQFQTSLENSFNVHEKKYLEIQDKLISEMFYISNKGASVEAATAVIDFLK